MTEYNGSKPCEKCGTPLTPVEVLFAQPNALCRLCRRKRAEDIVKGMMVE